jgi:hypothetical protein
MRVVSGIYLGAGTSALYLGLGFIPDWVKIRNIDQSAQEALDWSRNDIRAATAAEGLLRTTIGADDTGLTVLTEAAGIVPYYGGTVISTASANYQVPRNMESLFRGDMRVKTTTDINTWTLDTSASETGHVNTGVNTTYVGVGSLIKIKETSTGLIKTAAIVALTNDGDAANEVTLDRAIGTGVVIKIGYLYDLAAAPKGTVMPAGIYLADTTCNASAERCLIEAGTYDN